MSEYIKSLSNSLFWDVNRQTIDDEKNRGYVIQRVLERGGLNDVRLTVAHYTLPVVVDEAKHFKSLTPKALAFIACISNTPREEFACYTTKQSSVAPWIY